MSSTRGAVRAPAVGLVVVVVVVVVVFVFEQAVQLVHVVELVHARRLSSWSNPVFFGV